jgi:hypothetical protein
MVIVFLFGFTSAHSSRGNAVSAPNPSPGYWSLCLTIFSRFWKISGGVKSLFDSYKSNVNKWPLRITITWVGGDRASSETV